MKNEKLELLLNKVVEYNNPDGFHYKGFLYVDGYGYYIKVVDVISGTVNLKDCVYLKDGDDQFIIHADKPKLMRVSVKKSWHYKLLKYVMGSNAPTPQNMQNGCPYFWLAAYAILALPFVLLWQVIKFVFLLFPKMMLWCLKLMVDSWLYSLDDVQAYDIAWGGRKYAKMPKTAKIFFDKTDEDFLEAFLYRKYRLKPNGTSLEYSDKRNEISDRWKTWKKELDERRTAAQVEKQEKEDAHYRKRQEDKAKWEARMKPIDEGFTKFWNSVTSIFTFKPSGDWKTLIRRTKQFTGAVITILVLVSTYFLITFIVYALTVFIDVSIDNWYAYVALLLIGVAIGIGYLLYVVIGSWLQNVVNKYRTGKKVWYIEPLIYVVWYPVKYISIGIAYTVLYILLIPIKLVFFNFLWKLVIVNLAKFIWLILTKLWKGILSSTGIFGEYFGASYSDYCPGIEWVDTEDED